MKCLSRMTGNLSRTVLRRESGGNTADPADCVEDGAVYLTVTDMMTATRGRVPVDVTLLDGEGAVVGSFSFILWVERAALENQGLTQASYSGTVSRVAENMAVCSINDDGYLCIESDDGLGLTFSMDGEGKITITYNEEEASG